MPSLPSSGPMSIGTLNGFFGGSGTSLSNFYRGGGRVPSTRTSTVTVREPSSGEYWNGNYQWRVYSDYYGVQAIVLWGNDANNPNVSNINEYATSVTAGGYTYYRGNYRASIYTGDESPELMWEEYGIFRTYLSTVTTAINTGVPSSGTISLSNFYGAENS